MADSEYHGEINGRRGGLEKAGRGGREEGGKKKKKKIKTGRGMNGGG